MLTTLSDEPDWSQERLRRLLFGDGVPDLQGDPAGGGQAIGPLVVANLTVATHLLGTRFLPDLHGAILIFEDVTPYRIDRMLTQWRLSGALEQLAGIGFGNFAACDDDERPAAKRFSLSQVLESERLTWPCQGCLIFLWGIATATALPLGEMACLDGDSAVSA